jgi:hypothetical protein
MWINHFYVTVTKYLMETREERFILAHGFREFSSWLFDPMDLGEHHGGVWQLDML